jgi:hypothetical protein
MHSQSNKMRFHYTKQPMASSGFENAVQKPRQVVLSHSGRVEHFSTYGSHNENYRCTTTNTALMRIYAAKVNCWTVADRAGSRDGKETTDSPREATGDKHSRFLAPTEERYPPANKNLYPPVFTVCTIPARMVTSSSSLTCRFGYVCALPFTQRDGLLNANTASARVPEISPNAN